MDLHSNLGKKRLYREPLDLGMMLPWYFSYAYAQKMPKTKMTTSLKMKSNLSDSQTNEQIHIMRNSTFSI